jgi:hypothetical protein
VLVLKAKDVAHLVGCELDCYVPLEIGGGGPPYVESMPSLFVDPICEGMLFLVTCLERHTRHSRGW